MRHEVLSSRYAEALADAVAEPEQMVRARDELQALARALAEDRRFEVMVSIPARGREAKKAFFNEMTADLGLSAPIRRLLAHLVEKRRAGMLPQIAERFAAVADRRLGVVNAALTSAVPLTDEQTSKITDKLQAMTGRKVRVEQQVDESLIAGFHIRLDGRFFDGSLRAQLHRIREKIIHAG